MQFFVKIYIKFHQLQALNFNVKSVKCSVDPEYAEVKACFVKSLEHDSYNIDMNIVFIKEVTKLQVKSNWTCYCSIQIIEHKISGLLPSILQAFENQSTRNKFFIQFVWKAQDSLSIRESHLRKYF
jgi:hypothetical protein